MLGISLLKFCSFVAKIYIFQNKKPEIQLNFEDYSSFSDNPTPMHELATLRGLGVYKESLKSGGDVVVRVRRDKLAV